MNKHLQAVIVSLLFHGALFAGFYTSQSWLKSSEKPRATPINLAFFQQQKPKSVNALAEKKPQKRQRKKKVIVKKQHKKALVNKKKLKKLKKVKPAVKKIRKAVVHKVMPKKPQPQKKAAEKKSPGKHKIIVKKLAKTKPKKFVARVLKPLKQVVAVNHSPGKNQQKQQEQLFKQKLTRIIQKLKYYPVKARRRGLEGEVEVVFTLLANGKIKDIRLKKKSGSRLLDKAAVKTIKKISGKVRFPVSIKRQYWTLLVPIKYRLG